ncbi:hypothetical protein SDC9_88332 [bioreactor metagenome]|uniref:Uncharacterized protein n=1 Tax=bioreactor metagenome TaxID=1076179 RepID=A0A644ZLM2_9ZZZZ
MYHEVCPYRNNIKPRELDLTDTPRFNKAQMALLRGLYAVGIRVIQIGGSAVQGFRKDGTTDVRFSASLIGTDTSGEKYENLDLAELLGKDGAE